MEYVAIAKNIKISPRKVRLVVDGVKRQSVKNAIASLTVMNKRAAGPISKAINSAMANAKNLNAKADALSIKEILVSDSPVLKRYHFAARGRVRPYKRRASQIKIILTDGISTSIKEPMNAVSIEAKSDPKGNPLASKASEGKGKEDSK